MSCSGICCWVSLQYSKNTTAHQISPLFRGIQVCVYTWMLLAPIDSSLISTLSSERRLWAENAKMSVEFPNPYDSHIGLQRYKRYRISSYPANVCGYLFVCLTYHRYHLTMFSFDPVGGTVLPFLVLLIFLVLMCRPAVSFCRLYVFYVWEKIFLSNIKEIFV